MFTTVGPDVDDRELDIHSMASYAVLAEACAPFTNGSAGKAETELMVWSLVQGFATLSRRRSVHPARTAMQDVAFEDLLPPLTLRDDAA